MRPAEHIEAKRAEIRRLAVAHEERAGAVTPDAYALRLAAAALSWALCPDDRELCCMLARLQERVGTP